MSSTNQFNLVQDQNQTRSEWSSLQNPNLIATALLFDIIVQNMRAVRKKEFIDTIAVFQKPTFEPIVSLLYLTYFNGMLETHKDLLEKIQTFFLEHPISEVHPKKSTERPYTACETVIQDLQDLLVEVDSFSYEFKAKLLDRYKVKRENRKVYKETLKYFKNLLRLLNRILLDYLATVTKHLLPVSLNSRGSAHIALLVLTNPFFKMDVSLTQLRNLGLGGLIDIYYTVSPFINNGFARTYPNWKEQSSAASNKSTHTRMEREKSLTQLNIAKPFLTKINNFIVTLMESQFKKEDALDTEQPDNAHQASKHITGRARFLEHIHSCVDNLKKIRQNLTASAVKGEGGLKSVLRQYTTVLKILSRYATNLKNEHKKCKKNKNGN